ncbi:hypothetical protein CEXT_76921 [Caerostris extrusa]|uniref:Uncharacterized protein n=1 Tax=Caerostris extrusa TaxID=172846 RepID=A0AAV4MLW3_CAEEX|nr:hypothetical protein CEXT_76921 [Caerostris extrusa]
MPASLRIDSLRVPTPRCDGGQRAAALCLRAGQRDAVRGQVVQGREGVLPVRARLRPPLKMFPQRGIDVDVSSLIFIASSHCMVDIWGHVQQFTSCNSHL